MSADAEAARLRDATERRAHWKRWGPYLSERAWGTVREDYSPDGDAWDYFPHDHARARAYRWNEDGLARHLRPPPVHLLRAGALERTRSDPQGAALRPDRPAGQPRRGREGVLLLPRQHADALVHEGALQVSAGRVPVRAARGRERAPQPRPIPSSSCSTPASSTATATSTCSSSTPRPRSKTSLIRITVANRGPDAAAIDRPADALVPQSLVVAARLQEAFAVAQRRPRRRRRPSSSTRMSSAGATFIATASPELLFTNNETNTERLFKTAEHHAVREGRHPRLRRPRQAAAVNPAAHRHQGRGALPRDDPGRRTAGLPLAADRRADRGARSRIPSRSVFDERIAEADEFYDERHPRRRSPTTAKSVMRQAFAGLLWSKQFYHYVVRDWLNGDPGQPPPPAERARRAQQRLAHLYNADVISMPDKWEYPWYAAWDLAFHCIPLALVDPEFAKEQLVLLLREWYMHPNGQLPAYEWAFGDVNPPVHAWAALARLQDRAAAHRQAAIAGSSSGCSTSCCSTSPGGSTARTPRATTSSRAGSSASTTSACSIAASRCPAARISSSPTAPAGWRCTRSTCWPSRWSWRTKIRPTRTSPASSASTSCTSPTRCRIAATPRCACGTRRTASTTTSLHTPRRPPRSRSRCARWSGLIPLFAVETLEAVDAGPAARLPRPHASGSSQNRPDLTNNVASMVTPGQGERRLLSIVDARPAAPDPRRRCSTSASSCRPTASARSRVSTRTIPSSSGSTARNTRVDYEPAESTNGLFGGNSNWRGPIWFPVNYLLIESLQKFHYYFGDDFKVECPTGSGQMMNLWEVATELSRRLSSIFLQTGRPPRRSTAASSGSRPTRTGATWCSSTSTSTATPGRAWAPAIRPGGRRWSRSCCSRAAKRREDQP